MAAERDYKIARFIDEFGAATTRQIHEIFFDGLDLRNCQIRLRTMADRKMLKRSRAGIDKDYIYYRDTLPQQLEHMAIRVDFYIAAIKALDLVDFSPEYDLFGKLRPDAYFEFNYAGGRVGAFLEIQLSAGFNQDKYEKYYSSGAWQTYWTGFPVVVIVTDRSIRLRPSEITYIMMGLNFDFEKLKAALE